MPQEKGNPRDTVDKILRLECSTGYRDAAVVSGLEGLIEHLLPSSLPLVSGYAEAAPQARRAMIARLRDSLGLESEDSEPSETRAAKPKADLSRPMTVARGVGQKRAEGLRRLGLETMEDLLLYFPRRLEDRTQFTQIGDLQRGKETAVRGQVLAIDAGRPGRNRKPVKAAIGDGTGFLYGVWFNQPWVAQQLPKGEEIDLYGKVEVNYGEWQVRSPVWEPAGAGLEIGRLVPVYPATEGITDRYLRGLVSEHLDLYLPGIDDVVPASIRSDRGLLPRRRAIEMIHRPPNYGAFEKARQTLAFEELFLLQLGLLATTRNTAGVSHAGDGTLVDSFLASLPYALTRAQAAALREIVGDLRSRQQMMRLLQGDVGSGKTLVAVVAALAAIEAGYQAAFMVPTEILAEQHALNLEQMLEGLPVRIGLLTGATKAKGEIKALVEAGEIDLLLGTHALIQETVSFDALGLVIIDEQHRFGVVQRSLIEEKGDAVDLLVMSATPIPRTIALTLYGEFDVSVLDELPVGEKRIDTQWRQEAERPTVYESVSGFLAEGRKGFVVLPLVEESEKLDVKAATETAEELAAWFPEAGVTLLHGRMSSSDKASAMERFRDGRSQLLVSTTVIEVGIDVPDADFMVIEHADRFGLSQLHQLRGRIGRAGQPSVCFAISDAGTEEGKQRLIAFESRADGFAIAEEDLAIRGPGDLLGTQQHGYLTQLRAVDLIRDIELMTRARIAAREVHASGRTPALDAAVERRFGELLRWLRV